MTSNELEPHAIQFAGWVRDHGRAVRGFLFAMTRRADAADDLLQEVFRRAWQSRSAYHENGHARAYLLKIADRLVSDWRRQAHAEVTLDGDDWKKVEPRSGDDPLGEVKQQEESAQLQKAMRSLSPIQRRALLLRFFGQLSFAEIAEEIGCPLSTALSHCRRGLETLRTVLVDEK